MAQTYKVLAQSTPPATTVTDVYTVPALTAAVVSSIIVCNRAASPRTFRISLAVNAAADTIAQYIAYDMVVPANDSIFVQIGVTLGANDVIRVYVSATDISVNVFGVENA